jgi:hypothetical protein
MHAIVENIAKQCPTGFEQGKYHLLVSNLKTCQAGKPWGLVFQRPQFGGPGPRNGCSAKGPQSTSSLFDLITLYMYIASWYGSVKLSTIEFQSFDCHIHYAVLPLP